MTREYQCPLSYFPGNTNNGPLGPAVPLIPNFSYVERPSAHASLRVRTTAAMCNLNWLVLVAIRSERRRYDFLGLLID